jgi:hypothetical protein
MGNEMKKKLENWLLLEVWRCFLAEIYPSIRAVAISFDEDKRLLIRCYLDREPTEFDFDSLEDVAGSVSSGSPDKLIKKVDLEIEYSTKLFKDLDSLDGFVYMRREWV